MKKIHSTIIFLLLGGLLFAQNSANSGKNMNLSSFHISKIASNPGDLDPSFNSTGKKTTDFSSGDDEIKAVAIQSDGKIVAAGYATVSGVKVYALARYNTDGSLDNSFGTNGLVTTQIGSTNLYPNDMVIQPDGKIIVVGNFGDGTGSKIMLARYNSDGTLDTNFGTSGFAYLTLPHYASGLTVALQSDNKIIVGGGAKTASNFVNFYLARFTTGGVLDNTFGGSGNGYVTTDVSKVEFNYNNEDGSMYSIAIDNNDNIYCAGDVHISPTYQDLLALVKYTPSGSLDNTFGGNGIVTYNFGANGYGKSVAIQSDGKIVVAGTYSGSPNKFALFRFLSDGTLDNSFGTSGVTLTAIGSGNSVANSLALKGTGIVVSGFSYNGSNNDFAIAVYNSSGTLDNTFGTSGTVTTDFNSNNDISNAVAVNSSGSIIAGGSASNGSNLDFALAKYGGTTSLPVELTSFNALINENTVNLTWQTATEVNNYGFEVQRLAVGSQQSANAAAGSRTLNAGIWQKIGFVKGNGTSNSANTYSFTDNNPNLSMKTEYRLKQVNNDGTFKYSSILTVNLLPNKFELSQNYPNPFNPSTIIKYVIPQSEHVTLKVYDELGNEVRTLVNGNRSAGQYNVEFNGSNLASGIYFYKISAGNYSAVKKLMLLK